MKKRFGFLIPVLLAILSGYLFGEIVYNQYKNNVVTFDETNQVFFLQQGVYSTNDSLLNNTKELEDYLSIKEKEKYYVYIGITKNAQNAQKLKEIYLQKGNDIYIKELGLTDANFISMLIQYDNLIANTNDINEILSIEKSVLSTYEELVLNNDN